MNVVYAMSAYSAGVLADRMDRGRLLALGLGCLIAADQILAASEGLAGIAIGIGIALWGLHMGLTQGPLSTLVADTAPADLRGTAFGVFNLACGVAMLAASALAGVLWDWFGPCATFLSGAILAAVALVGLLRLQGCFGIARTGRD